MSTHHRETEQLLVGDLVLHAGQSDREIRAALETLTWTGNAITGLSGGELGQLGYDIAHGRATIPGRSRNRSSELVYKAFCTARDRDRWPAAGRDNAELEGLARDGQTSAGQERMASMDHLRTLDPQRRSLSRVLIALLGLAFLGLAAYDVATGDLLLAVGHLLVTVLAALAFYLASATPDRPHATQKRVTLLTLCVVFPIALIVQLAWILV